MYKNPSKIRMKPARLGFFGAIFAISVSAEEASESTGFLGYLGADVNETQFMKDLGLKVGGWIDAGITYNANEPAGRYNGPVTFNDRASEFQLNQLYFYLQRPVNTEGNSWDFGGRFDFMFGSDAVFTQAYGSPRGHWDLHLIDSKRFYDMALPQAYFEIFAPFGNGITAKIGHFYTIIGNETVTAPDNFFYSHAYTMQFGEPFTHTGVLLSYPIDQNWTVTAGGVTGSDTGGWDGAWDKGLGNWAGIGGVTWVSDDKGTSIALTGTTGETSEQDHNNWSLYSVVIKHDITEGLHYTFQHDHGFQNKVPALGGRMPRGTASIAI
ncbi:porin [Methylocaldum sp. MU1018]